MKKYNFDFKVTNILKNPRSEWKELVAFSRGRNIRTAFRDLDVDWKKYNTKDYLFTHDTIVCSVETEKNGYWITKPCEELVNANGNAWTNKVLLNSFRTFIGGENFLEHCQIQSLSKGKILDAIIRPVVHANNYGTANIYFCDILVATDRKHYDLVKRIESGQLNTLSMGAIANVTQCSICGKVFKDDNEEVCEHLKHHIGGYCKCSDGKSRVCAEFVGACDEKGEYIPNSCQFIEASWVEHPAFKGAVVNSFVETEEERQIRESSKDELVKLFEESLFERLKVADTPSAIALKITNIYSKAERYIKIAKKISRKK